MKKISTLLLIAFALTYSSTINAQEKTYKDGSVWQVANPEDWDVMLITEYKSLSAMEGIDEKWEAISKKVIGGEEATKKLNESRVSMRMIYGGKLLREVIYK